MASSEPTARANRMTLRRRVLLLLALAGATVALWALLFEGRAGNDAATGAGGSGVSAAASQLAGGLTTKQQVDQTLLLGFEGTNESSPIVDRLRSRQLGGVLVDSPNWVDSSQGRKLISKLHTEGARRERIPPLVAAPQEGGPYRAFSDLGPAERQLDIGDRGDARLAEAWARNTGESLRAVGVDLNLSPVADVATLDSPIADRAFSDGAAVAAEMTAAAVRGCRRAGIGCAALHFPGLGAASQDTDQGPATVSLDPESLRDRDLAAFRAAFAERVPAVVLSLAFYAGHDPITPGALAPEVATDLLRGEMDYEGAAITDDLSAGAITATGPVPDAAVAALRAGADMLQIRSPEDQDGVRGALLRAVESGDIPEDRLAEAAGRVLELKRRIGLISFR